jgi:hypothetical protein
MSELVAKTGDFHLRVEVGPDVSEDTKQYQWRLLLDKMTRLLANVSKDDRLYELQAKLCPWEPAEYGMERRRVDFTLVLVHLWEAEVGEWVKRLPYLVPDEVSAVRLHDDCGLASGWVFERSWFGWRRVE